MRSLDLLKPHIPNTFGTAGWLTKAEALHRDLNQRGEGAKLCPYIGALPDLDRENSNATMIYARRADQLLEGARRTEGIREGSGHLITFAPTRAGKGTGQIIPNLLTWQGSTIVIDVKGENYKCSAGHRKENLKQRVIRFAPFEDVSDRWNPIMSIRAAPKNPRQTPEEEEDVRYLTNLLIAPTGNDSDKFWENSAKNFLEGLILHVRIGPLHAASGLDMKQPEEECQVTERSMREVRRLLTLGEEAFKCLLDSMQGSTRTLVKQAGSTLSKLMKGEGRTGLSILSVALEQTSVWAYSRLQNVTYVPGGQEGAEPAPNDFEFSDLRDGKTSLYIIVPPEYLTEYRTVLRVLTGMAMRQLRNSYSGAAKEKPPVLFLLDEFPQLAYMQPIEEALLYLAGYGVRFWFFVQDLSQLQLHYPKTWRTFMANTGTQCFYGVSDIQTANLVSEMAGTATVVNRSFGANVNRSDTDGGSESRTSGRSGGSSWGPGGSGSNSGWNDSTTVGTSWSHTEGSGESVNAAFVGRRIMMPDEVMRMHDEEQVIFMKGVPPIRAMKPPYFRVEDYLEKTNISPPFPVNFD